MTGNAPSTKRGRMNADSGADLSSAKATWPLDVQQVIVDSLLDYKNLARRGQVQPAVFDSPTPAVVRFAADKLATYGFESYANNETRLRKEISALVSYYRCYNAAVELVRASGNAILSKQETSQLKEQFTIKSVRRVAEKGMELARLGLAIDDLPSQGGKSASQPGTEYTPAESRESHSRADTRSESRLEPRLEPRPEPRLEFERDDHLDMSNTLGFDVSSSFEAANPLPRLQSKAPPAISPRPSRQDQHKEPTGYEPLHSTPISKPARVVKDTQTRKRDLPEYFEIDHSSEDQDEESTLHGSVQSVRPGLSEVEHKAGTKESNNNSNVSNSSKDPKDPMDLKADQKIDSDRILEMSPEMAETSISFTLARSIAETSIVPINKARLLEYLASHREMRMFLVQLLQSDYAFFEYMLDYLLKYTIT